MLSAGFQGLLEGFDRKGFLSNNPIKKFTNTNYHELTRIMKVFAIELNGCEGIYDVVYVAANDRDEAVDVLKASRQSLTWYDVMWLEGASYETDKPCEIEPRLCTEDGEII